LSLHNFFNGAFMLLLVSQVRVTPLNFRRAYYLRRKNCSFGALYIIDILEHGVLKL